MFATILLGVRNSSTAWCPLIRNLYSVSKTHTKINKTVLKKSHNDDKLSVARNPVISITKRKLKKQNLNGASFWKPPFVNEGIKGSFAAERRFVDSAVKLAKSVAAPIKTNHHSKEDSKAHYDDKVYKIKANAKDVSFRSINMMNEPAAGTEAVRLDEEHLVNSSQEYKAPLCLNNYYKILANTGKLAKICVRQTGFTERHVSWYTRNDKRILMQSSKKTKKPKNSKHSL